MSITTPGGDAALAALAAGLHADRDVVLWRGGQAGPFSGAALHVVDMRGRMPGEVPVGAGLLLAGSAAAAGAWAARAGGVPVAIVPEVAPPPDQPGEAPPALHLLLGACPGPAPLAIAERAASWAGRNGLAVGVADASGAAGLVLTARFGRTPALGPGAIALDLRAGLERLELPEPLLAIMAAGGPVLAEAGSPVGEALAADGAGWVFSRVEDGLAQARAERRTASEAVLRVVRERHSLDAARAALERAIGAALDATPPGPAPHVLVVSDEAPNLRHLRVDQPFAALAARGAIAGYTVLHRGAVLGEVAAGARFGAIWVQRSADPDVRLLLHVFRRPFVYDLDDNLLLSPSYREQFEAEGVESVQALIRDCAALSCGTARLARGLPASPGKAIVTPNLAFEAGRVAPGPARCVVWASSDAPALAGSRPAVERAVRDFCRAHGLPILCVGAPPPERFTAAGIAVEHQPILPYPAYLERLRAAAPGILVGPLETDAEPATQGFVDGKSDIKMLEARLSGLVGVFSRAAPYVDSELGPAILCENSYGGWLDGLARARAQCERPGTVPRWPAGRDAAQEGLAPWATALRAAPTDLSIDEVRAALHFVRAQGETLLESPAAFDEADYLRRHKDVAAAVEAGVLPSGYRHFVQSGFREGRVARAKAGARSVWWARLLHEVGALEARVPAQGREIAALRDRLAVRRLVPDRAPPRPAMQERPAEADGVRWETGAVRALPCPVCGAAGPHPVALEIARSVLLRCAACATRFDPDRLAHDYADAVPEIVLQFGLEQNASIHHQTGLLFGTASGNSVLDVGCGFGFAVDLAARELSWRAVGLDPGAAGAMGRAVLGADVRPAYLTPASDVGPAFDRVIASEMIEHVPDPLAALALLRDRLAAGGVLALTTPNGAALRPGMDRGRRLGIAAPGIHLTLFTAGSLELALRRSGFAHVAVVETADTLVAEASDRPLQRDEAAAERHGAAYRRYLEGLLDRAEAGSPLWNGAVGRLFALLAPGAEIEVARALFARIAAAWLDRFGIDLESGRLPALLGEFRLRTTSAAALGAGQPFCLAPVLLSRAVLEARSPGRRPEGVLRFARPALTHAVETRRVLQAENLIDLDLKRTAWEARLLIASCLAELAPELEGEIWAAVAAESPGLAADWLDAPRPALIPTVARYFVAAVAADRFDDARRVERFVADPADLRDDPELLLRTCFTLGVLRLVGDDDPAAGLLAFERLANTAREIGGALGRDYLRLAEQHMAMATESLGGRREGGMTADATVPTV